MLPTFVIGLREGLEAALIVSIVAAFLKQQGRSELLRLVYLGIFAAVAICAAAAVGLELLSRDLPQRQQEGLETVIGLVAVGMVTYMVVWMRRHSRNLKKQLESAAGSALATGSGMALVAMAFLAVLREGMETAVFLLAAFNESGSGLAAAIGAVLGVLCAVGLGYAMYRGGIRINLSRFFRATGAVLVLVAAGLVVNALHTAHEAGWLNIGQQQVLDLTGIVRPGSVQASLLTGILGLQPQPVLAEVVGWLLYAVPVGLYVVWPPGRGLKPATLRRVTLIGGAVAGACAIVLALINPAAPARFPATTADGSTTALVSRTDSTAVVRTTVATPVAPLTAPTPGTLMARRVGATTYHGVDATLYRARLVGRVAGPAEMSLSQLSRIGGGHLPIGVLGLGGTTPSGSKQVPVDHRSLSTATFWVASDTGRVLDVRWRQQVSLIAHFSIGAQPVGPTRSAGAGWSDETVAGAVSAAASDAARLGNRQIVSNIAVLLAIAAIALLATAGLTTARLARDRRRTPTATEQATPVAAPQRVG